MFGEGPPTLRLTFRPPFGLVRSGGRLGHSLCCLSGSTMHKPDISRHSTLPNHHCRLMNRSPVMDGRNIVVRSYNQGPVLVGASTYGLSHESLDLAVMVRASTSIRLTLDWT